MAKKKQSKTKRPQSSIDPANENVPVAHQTAGSVTGAVIGAVVAGPVGELAGGVTGALVGDASAKGKRPVKRAVDAVRSEVSSGRVMDAMKSVKDKITSLSPFKKKKKAATKKKSASASASAAKKSKSKTAEKEIQGREEVEGCRPRKKSARRRNARPTVLPEGCRTSLDACFCTQIWLA